MYNHFLIPLEIMAEFTFPLLGEPLAVDLINTVAAVGPGGALVDLITTPDALAAWLCAEAPRLGTNGSPLDAPLPSLEAVHALRGALRALFRAVLRGEPPDPAAVATVNRASAAAAPYAVLVWPAEGAPSAAVEHRAPDPAAVPLATIARSGIEILAGEVPGRLHACEGPGCVLLFLASNPRRRWCSPTGCGNRVRVARHYRQHRARDRAATRAR